MRNSIQSRTLLIRTQKRESLKLRAQDCMAQLLNGQQELVPHLERFPCSRGTNTPLRNSPVLWRVLFSVFSVFKRTALNSPVIVTSYTCRVNKSILKNKPFVAAEIFPRLWI